MKNTPRKRTMNKKLVTSISLMLLSFAIQADTLSELHKCANTKDSLVRLMCYDTLVKSLNSGQATLAKSAPVAVRATEANSTPAPLRPTTEIVKVQKQPESTASKEDSFGEEHIEKSKEMLAQEIEQVVFTVQSTSKDARKKWRINFTNGQVWHQTDGQYIKLSEGDEVELSKGVLGVIYLKKVGQNKKIRVKRKK